MIEYELVKIAGDEEPRRKLRHERTRIETLRRLVELGYVWDKGGEPIWDEEEGLYLPEDIEAGDERPPGAFEVSQRTLPEVGSPDDMSWWKEEEYYGYPPENGHGDQATGANMDILKPEGQSKKWRDITEDDTPPQNPPVPPVTKMLLKAFGLWKASGEEVAREFNEAIKAHAEEMGEASRSYTGESMASHAFEMNPRDVQQYRDELISDLGGQHKRMTDIRNTISDADWDKHVDAEGKQAFGMANALIDDLTHAPGRSPRWAWEPKHNPESKEPTPLTPTRTPDQVWNVDKRLSKWNADDSRFEDHADKQAFYREMLRRQKLRGVPTEGYATELKVDDDPKYRKIKFPDPDDPGEFLLDEHGEDRFKVVPTFIQNASAIDKMLWKMFGFMGR